MRYLFKKYFTLLSVIIFGFFLGNPVFAMQGVSHEVILVSSGYGTSCTQNIQCQKISEDRYECYSAGELYSNTGFQVQNTPVGSIDTRVSHKCIFAQYSPEYYHQKKEVAYIEPEPYMYPFVRIIKIQV